MRLATSLSALLLAAPCASIASTFSVDVSDLWWNPSESGWGLNLIQEADVAFGTLFVYGQDGQAHWYAAPDLQGSHTSTLDGGSFTGPLFETAEPGINGKFNPAALTTRQVGTMTFGLEGPDAGFLSYTIDGLTTQKSVTRQTWRTNDINGNYALSRVYRGYHCGPDAAVTLNLGTATVSQSGNSLSITTTGGLPSCTFSGDYSQSGRMGLSSGSFSCTDGTSGSYRMQEIEVGQHAFSARFDGTAAACQFRGHLGGPRADVQLPPD